LGNYRTYFYPKGVSKLAKNIKKSDRGEYEITTLNDCYLKSNKLKAQVLDDAFTWFDTGTFDSQLDAANMIRTIEKNKNKVIFKGWITKDKLKERAKVLT